MTARLPACLLTAAKALAKKFAALYYLLEDLLSPQKHYDCEWPVLGAGPAPRHGLFAVNKVLHADGNAMPPPLAWPTRCITSLLQGACVPSRACWWWRAACCAARRGRTRLTCCSARCGELPCTRQLLFMLWQVEDRLALHRLPSFHPCPLISRARSDFNLPKILAQDLVVFNGLLADIFPQVGWGTCRLAGCLAFLRLDICSRLAGNLAQADPGDPCVSCRLPADQPSPPARPRL